MRKQQLIILLLAILTIGFIGCEKEKTSEVSDTAGDEIEEEVVEKIVLYSEDTLDPALVTADTPVAAWMLYEAYFAWNGKQVTLAVYPYIPYMG